MIRPNKVKYLKQQIAYGLSLIKRLLRQVLTEQLKQILSLKSQDTSKRRTLTDTGRLRPGYSS